MVINHLLNGMILQVTPSQNIYRKKTTRKIKTQESVYSPGPWIFVFFGDGFPKKTIQLGGGFKYF